MYVYMKRDERHERRRGALYCIIFLIHIFPSNIQSFVL